MAAQPGPGAVATGGIYDSMIAREESEASLLLVDCGSVQALLSISQVPQHRQLAS